MLAITTKLEHIGHWIRMRPSLARFSASVSSFHAPSWADFITTTLAFRFSVHTRLMYANAQVYMSQADFDYWTDERQMDSPCKKPVIIHPRTNLLPVRDRLV